MLKTTVAATALCTAFASAVPHAAQAGKNDDTLRVALAEEILNLDYNYTTKREYIIMAELTDATLFDLDPETQEFAPAVASDWEWVDDTTLNVDLREGVTFHDGSELSAEDVAYTYNWIVSDESEAQAKGTIERWLETVEVTGDLSLRFHLKSVYPLVLRDMAQRVKLRPEGAYEAEDGSVDESAMATDLVGAGPYKVVSFEPGQEVVLERFEEYWGEAPAIENVVVRNLPDIGTQQAELMAGGVDWMFKVPLDVAESLGNMPQAAHLSGPDLRVGFLVLDAAGYTDEDGPLTNVKVRQAVNHALNREEMAEYLIGGSAKPIYTPCHPAQFGCTEDIPAYPYDPEKSKALLEEAGYGDGFQMDLWAYRDKPAAEAIAADLEAVGIDVNLRYVKLASLNQARAQREIPAYFGTWGSGGTADTAAIARVHFAGDSDRNLSGDGQLTETVLSAEQTADPEERKKIYEEALTTIAEQAYWAPLFSYSQNYLVNPDLEFPLSPDGLPRLDKASWK
ncbi:ABC transporter substrate-binding protein [Roseicyclus sp. F158]|uniref:ABC transporter substrate-binding protein n=1 Tax=Tropicimonas omnivorans TaxID=3075590 RepID=A0ABU3DEI0_9RHOB|nr:ABC transporter substrate-binding protein [Roseicyclus sp. F158]MDT0682082.1 ABC transporter substrate-binding protein [Roseicyclus sp. F158]